MLIHSVRLENFKSYEHATILFELGTNAIVGQNGAGKSSILEAIGFTMFAHAGTARQSDLLREGATSGSVTVTFCSSLDERRYEVERVLGKTGTTRHRIYDPDAGGMVLAESVNEVTRWLREHLGIDQASSLDDLFRNTIGVPQGTFTAPFLMTAGERKHLFDPLLQVDEYDRAYQKLLETARHLAGQRNALNQEIARLEGMLAQLPALITEQEALQTDIASLDRTARTLEATLAAARDELERLNLAEHEVRRVEQARAQIAAQHQAAEHARQSADLNVREAEQASARLADAEPGYREYLAAEARRHALEQDRIARDKSIRALEQQRVAESRVQTRLEQVQQALDEITAAERDLAELQPDVTRQAELQQALEDARAEERIVQETRRQIDIVKRDLSDQREQLAGVDAELARVPGLLASLARLEQALESIAATEGALTDERSSVQAYLSRLKEQSEALEREHGATCPVCEGELKPEHRRELLRRNQEQTRTLSARLNAIAAELRTCSGKKAQAQRERSALEQLLRAQPSQAQRDQLADAISNSQKRLDALMKRITESEQRAARVTTITQELGALGDPAARAHVLASRIATRDRRKAEKAELEAESSRLATESALLQQQLAQYVRLDETLAQVAQTLARTRDAHDQFLSARDLASRLEQRRQELEDCQRQVTELSARLDALTQEQARASEGYDASQHALVRQQVEQANAQVVRARTQLASSQGRLAVVERQIGELEAAQLTRRGKQRETEHIAGLTSMLEEMRTLLHSAGPYVTRQLVANISTQASAFYADIMNDYAGRLTWSEDYELSLEVKGYKRSFQQLSGGEQMSAALALRLALLRQLTNINVAFFDEPTAHLDPERRDGLAEKIMQVKGFDQLFVISHDDTFERAAQNYIRIVKENGVSMVAGS